MNSNTNEKINQVSENTLVIGIDIAKHKHFACASMIAAVCFKSHSQYSNHVLDLMRFMNAYLR